MSTSQIRGIHLLGSLPLSTAAEAFSFVGENIPHHVKRFPDGEGNPEHRSGWVACQAATFSATPGILTSQIIAHYDHSEPVLQGSESELLKAEDIKLNPVGYDDWALASYRDFAALKKQGTIPQHARFQVCLPSPVAGITVFVRPEYQKIVEPMFENALLAALRRIQDSIPASELAIQWDVAPEHGMLEQIPGPFFKPWFGDGSVESLKVQVAERLARLTSHVDQGVEVGIHQCYGSMGNKHFVEPPNMGKLVDVANLVQARMTRRLDWLHMPVPKDRVDDAYFEPLKGLQLGQETEFYLGVLHPDDPQGTKERIVTAQRHLGGRSFGVATECGMGRGWSLEEAKSVLAIGKAVAVPQD